MLSLSMKYESMHSKEKFKDLKKLITQSHVIVLVKLRFSSYLRHNCEIKVQEVNNLMYTVESKELAVFPIDNIPILAS